MKFSPLIDDLIDALTCMPGIGPKSAQRIAIYLLEKDRDGGHRLASALEASLEKVGKCRQCNNLSENEICQLCNNPSRNPEILCVVETPADLLAIESSGAYNGLYHVLMGHLSPIDGIGPEEIGINHLMERINEEQISELILATNATTEGEATAFYILEKAREINITVSRIAHGVPIGGELEYVDRSTLSRAISGRHTLEIE